MKCLIVEGRSDKERLQRVLAEDVTIVCTNGTIGQTALEELLAPYEHYTLYTFFDADKSGDALRKLMMCTYPEAIQLQTTKMYKQVAETPKRFLANVLAREGIRVKIDRI